MTVSGTEINCSDSEIVGMMPALHSATTGKLLRPAFHKGPRARLKRDDLFNYLVHCNCVKQPTRSCLLLFIKRVNPIGKEHRVFIVTRLPAKHFSQVAAGYRFN